MFRFTCYCPRPSLSSLFWRWVGWHDDFVDVTFAAVVTGGFVGCFVGASASFLVMVLACIAGCAGVPNRHVVPARVAVVVVVIPLVGVGLIIPAVVSRGWWNASLRRGRNGQGCCLGVNVIAPSAATTATV